LSQKLGKARLQRQTHEQLLKAFPICIYCGINQSEGIDHCPPKMMFQNKDRPPGFEIPSCKKCNHGTSHADIVASFLGRAKDTKGAKSDIAGIKKLLDAAANNFPESLHEMDIGRGGQKIARKATGYSENEFAMRVSGPIVSRHMEAFSAKLAIAADFELNRRVLPAESGIVAEWYSNADRMTGRYQPSWFDGWDGPETLRQGQKEVSEQFAYSFYKSPTEPMRGYLLTFRQSFAVVGIVSLDRSFFDQNKIERTVKVRGRSEIGQLFASLKSKSP
jgi:hypothetical protein